MIEQIAARHERHFGREAESFHAHPPLQVSSMQPSLVAPAHIGFAIDQKRPTTLVPR